VATFLEALKANREGKRVKPRQELYDAWFDPKMLDRHNWSTGDIEAEWIIEELPQKFEFECEWMKESCGDGMCLSYPKIDEISDIKSFDKIINIGGRWKVTCEQVKE